jgi:PhzF family phenazine biosynthesis protein
MKLFQIDAFTDRVFAGNPAAVVPLEAWPDDGVLLAIAGENNLSETAFFVPGGEGGADYHLRWFTPTLEVPLCGHATLAAAHVLFEHLGFAGETIRFSTRHAGELRTTRQSGSVVLDFPARSHEAMEVATPLVRALGRQPVEVYRSGDNLMCVYDSKRDVLEIEPDAGGIAAIDALGVIATAPGTRHDFVSRYFAPGAGVVEDPVTGSAHCSLAPYWAHRLGKKRLTAHQVSKRGGEMICELDETGERVRLIGRSVTYLIGDVYAGLDA